MPDRLPLRGKLTAAIVVPLVAIVPLAFVIVSTFRAVQINGAQYEEIIEAEDLVADVLPPPHYLIEAYLTARELVGADGAEQQELLDRLDRLEAEFEASSARWVVDLEDLPDIAEVMNGQAASAGRALFVAINTQLLPVIADQAASEVVIADVIQPLYVEHRAGVDQVVAAGLARQVVLEGESSDLVSNRFQLLGIAGAVILAVIAVAGVVITRSIRRPLDALRHQAHQTAAEWLPRAVEQSQSGEAVDVPPVQIPGTRDEIRSLAESFAEVQSTALRLATEQAQLRRDATNSFVQLGRRNHGLLGRSLEQLTRLEADERDPERLGALYRVDHLTTRMRRNAESLLVLAGTPPLRVWSQPVPVIDVVRSAVSEIGVFERIEIVTLEDAPIRGVAVADVSHLIAELLENGAAFSPPGAPVKVYGRSLSLGYQLAVVDEGIGMTDEQLVEAHERFRAQGTVAEALLATMGFFVVGRLAARHGLQVRLSRAPSGGVAATIVVPESVLGERITVMDGPVEVRPATAGPSSLPVDDDSSDARRRSVMARLQTLAVEEGSVPSRAEAPIPVGGGALPQRAASASNHHDDSGSPSAPPRFDPQGIGSALGSFQQGQDAAQRSDQ